jgi:hypothetical protein
MVKAFFYVRARITATLAKAQAPSQSIATFA